MQTKTNIIEFDFKKTEHPILKKQRYNKDMLKLSLIALFAIYDLVGILHFNQTVTDIYAEQITWEESYQIFNKDMKNEDYEQATVDYQKLTDQINHPNNTIPLYTNTKLQLLNEYAQLKIDNTKIPIKIIEKLDSIQATVNYSDTTKPSLVTYYPSISTAFINISYLTFDHSKQINKLKEAQFKATHTNNYRQFNQLTINQKVRLINQKEDPFSRFQQMLPARNYDNNS